MVPDSKTVFRNGNGRCNNHGVSNSTEDDFEQFLKKQCSILSAKYTFLNSKQIRQKALDLWKSSRKTKDGYKTNKESNYKQRNVDKPSFLLPKSRDGSKKLKTVPLPINILKVHNNKNERKIIIKDRHVTFNNELDVRYRTTSEEGSTSTRASKKSENHSKTVNGCYLNGTSISKVSSNKNMARRNTSKQNFDFLINDKCSWSYKAQKIVKTSNTGNEESKIESTLTTIHVSQKRSCAGGRTSKILKNKARGKKQSRNKKAVETSDTILGLFEYGDMGTSNEKREFSVVTKKSTPVVTEETLSSMSPCSSESTNVLLSRDVARIDECNDSADDESLPDVVPHDGAYPLIAHNSELNSVVDSNGLDSGYLEKDDALRHSPHLMKVSVDELPLEESEMNLDFETKLPPEKNDENKKPSLVVEDRVILPHKKNDATTVSSLSAGSPSSDGRIESACYEAESNRSSDAKEDEIERWNQSLAHNRPTQQSKNELSDKSLTFADEVRGVCEELKTYTLCTGKEIYDDYMSGTFSIKKYQQRERELKVSPNVPRNLKRYGRKGVNDDRLFSNEFKKLLEDRSNIQGNSSVAKAENHLPQRKTNVSRKRNEVNSEKELSDFLQNDRHDTENEHNKDGSPLDLKISPSNWKTNTESNRKRSFEANSKKETNSRKLLQDDQGVEDTKHFTDTSPLGLNLTKVNLKTNEEANKYLAHENNDQLYSTNEMQQEMSNKLFSEAQNTNKKHILKKNVSIQKGHISELVRNKYKNDKKEMNAFSCKPVNSTHAEDLLHYERGNGSKNGTNISPSDVEEDGSTTLDNEFVNNVLKHAELMNRANSKNIFKEDTKAAQETKFTDSVSERKKFDRNINEDLFVENSESTNIFDENFSRKDDTENSIDSDASNESESPRSDDDSSPRILNEKSSFVPVNEKVTGEPKMFENTRMKAKRAVENKNGHFLTGFESERSSVKYNLRNKRTAKEPKQRENVPRLTAPSKASNKKAPNKQNVRKTKQNTETKRYQAKRKKNTNSSFVASSPIITPIKRLIGCESELKTIEKRKKPKTWRDVEKEILQDRRVCEASSSLHSITPGNTRRVGEASSSLHSITPGNTYYAAVSRKEKSTMRNGKIVKSARHFSGYVSSGKSTDVEFENFSVFRARPEKQAPNEIQQSPSQAIVGRTLEAMQKCKLDYMKQVEVFENKGLSLDSLVNSLSSNSGYESSLESEDPYSNECHSIKAVSAGETSDPLPLASYTKFSYKNSKKKSAVNAVKNTNKIKGNKSNISVKSDSNVCPEDSGFQETSVGKGMVQRKDNIASESANPWENQETFVGNEVIQNKTKIDSESANPWEKLEKRLQLCEEKIADFTKRPIVHYLTKASSASEQNDSHLAAEQFHHNSIEITSSDSANEKVLDRKRKKNREAPSEDLVNETKDVSNDGYWNLPSSEENHTAFSEEDSDLKFNNEYEHLAPKFDFNNSGVQEDDDNQMMISSDDRNKPCPPLKFPPRSVPNDDPVLLARTNNANAKFNQIDDVSSSESDERGDINNAIFNNKINNSSKYDNREPSNENLNRVRQEKHELKQRTRALRGKEKNAPECVGRRRQRKKTRKISSEDETSVEFLYSPKPKQTPRVQTQKRYNIRQKKIPTIDLSSDSESDHHKKKVVPNEPPMPCSTHRASREKKKEVVSTRQNDKRKQSKEEYTRYIGKVLQKNAQTSENSQTSLIEEIPFKNCHLLAQDSDDRFSISSGDISDTNLKGVGLLCDILAEQE